MKGIWPQVDEKRASRLSVECWNRIGTDKRPSRLQSSYELAS